MLTIEDLKNIHSGETIFILGNGTRLKDLTQNEIDTINNGISIGCNASHLVFEDTDYFMTGHYVQLLLNHYFGNSKVRIFQGEPTLDNSLKKTMNVIQTTNRNVVTHNMSEMIKDINENSNLVGAEQIGFAATHIAMILGASRVVYVGFDHKSTNHFYSFEPFKETIKHQLESLRETFRGDTFIQEDIDDFGTPSYFNEYYKTLNQFKDIFHHLKNTYNITPCTIEANSIIAEAGAEVLDL